MCKCLGRSILFLITFPFLSIFLFIYLIICGLYLLFIKIPSYYCIHVICTKNDDEYEDDFDVGWSTHNNNKNEKENMNELKHSIPHILTPKGAVKECSHLISKTKLYHYYLSYVFNRKIAHRLVRIRKRFDNGYHQTDVLDNKPFVKIYGGNNTVQWEKFIQRATSNMTPLHRKRSSLQQYPSSHNIIIDNEDDEKKQNEDAVVGQAIETTFTDLDALSAAIVEYHNGNRLEHITILDLASRRHVGGWGFCPYGGTQEEDLIRSSNLYWLLHPKYNEDLQGKLVEGDIEDSHIPYFGTVYLPNIIFLSGIDNYDDDEEEERKNDDFYAKYNISKEKEYKFNVIASAAPDMRPHSNEYKSYFGTANIDSIKSAIKKKLEAIIATCIITENTSILIAGAYGCGAYKCDTKMIAQCFKDVISMPKYQNKGLKKIVFAIAYDEQKLNIFRDVLS